MSVEVQRRVAISRSLYLIEGKRSMYKRIVTLLILMLYHNYGFASEYDVFSNDDKEMKYLITDMALAGNRVVAVGAHGRIAISDDEGNSWYWATSSATSLLTSVFFIDQNTGWATGHDGLILSTSDGGLTWAIQFNGLDEAANYGEESYRKAKQKLAEANTEYENDRAKGGNRVDLEIALEDAKLSVELARKFIDQPVADPLFDVLFIDEKNGYSAGAYGQILSTKDGGESWQKAEELIDNLDGYHIYSLAMFGSSIYFVGEAGLLHKYDLGEKQSSVLETPYYGTYFGINRINGDDSKLIVFGLKGNLSISRDAGKTWIHRKVNTSSSLYGSEHLHCGKLLISGDAGILILLDDTSESIMYMPQQSPYLGTIKSISGKLMSFGVNGIDINTTKVALECHEI